MAMAHFTDSLVDVIFGDALRSGSLALTSGLRSHWARDSRRRAAPPVFFLTGFVQPINLGENVLYGNGHDLEIIIPVFAAVIWN